MKTYRDDLHMTGHLTANQHMHVACAIARTIGQRPPTYRWFVEKFGMNRSTAYRWLRAWKDANGVA